MKRSFGLALAVAAAVVAAVVIRKNLGNMIDRVVVWMFRKKY